MLQCLSVSNIKERKYASLLAIASHVGLPKVKLGFTTLFSTLALQFLLPLLVLRTFVK